MKIIRLKIFNKKKLTPLDIIRGCQRGDTDCQEIFFKRYTPLLMTICRRYEYPSFGASDILQEAFITIFSSIKKYDPEKAEIESWLYKITVNTALKILRKRKMSFIDMEESHFQMVDEVEPPQDVKTASEEYILEAITSLPLGYRTVFNMFIIDGFSHKEIAEVLGISVQTSKSQLSKAKKLLRTKLALNTTGKKYRG